MTERLMGLETEYPFVAFNKDGTRADSHQTMSLIERLAEKHLPHLPGKGQRGIFLQNASRFYRDFSNNDAHQEMTTPECPNPWDAVRYVVANEQILLGLTRQLVQDNSLLREALYFKHNVDYSGARTSWGTHESYLTRTPIRELPEPLLPHLVSRIVFTGAGGFNPLSAKLEFMLSPRVAHLSEVMSLDTERNRPVFNLRDEPLCNGGYYRLHVICGESLCSHTGMWLRSATTALVVALADGGVKPGIGVTLLDPVNAMRTFAKDPTCCAKAMLASGKTATAIEIQRHYLNLAEAHVAANFMPPWAPQVCQHWRAILDRLEGGAPESVTTTLDWAIKFSMFSDRLQLRGFDWNNLPCNGNSAQLEELRQQLFEVDIRYGQLGERGIFAGLDRAGVLQHQFPGVDNFPHAMANPPNLGRARLRGMAIQRLSGRNHRASCDWAGVWNMAEQKFLDLSRPFEDAEHWKPFAAPQQVPNASDEGNLALRIVERSFHEGSFEKASHEIRAFEQGNIFMSPPLVTRFLRLKAWVQARRGHLDGVEMLNYLHDRSDLGLSQIADYLYVFRFSALSPRPAMVDYINSALNHFGGQPTDDMPASFREHWGAYLVWTGQVAEAEGILEGAVPSGVSEERAHGRRLATLGNLKRLLGNTDQARSLLEQARQQQLEHKLFGDLTDFTLPNLAKLMANTDLPAARTLLSQAKTDQARTRNRLGLIRTLLLDARLAARGDVSPHSNDAIVVLAPDVPSLATCELFKQIMDRWEIWTHDFTVVEKGDIFWGL